MVGFSEQYKKGTRPQWGNPGHKESPQAANRLVTPRPNQDARERECSTRRHLNRPKKREQPSRRRDDDRSVSPPRRRRDESRSHRAALPPRETGASPRRSRMTRRSRSSSASSRSSRSSRSRSSSSSSSDSDSELFEGYLSDSDDEDERARAWMRERGRRVRGNRERPADASTRVQ